MYIKLWSENVNRRANLGHVLVNGIIILNWITNKWNIWRFGLINIHKGQGAVAGFSKHENAAS
jgi:hypothetical protein